MSTITTINATDLITDSRAVINTNFSNLNTDKIETSTLDTDTTLAANSDAKIPSQKAVKAYVDALGGLSVKTSGVGSGPATSSTQTVTHSLGRIPTAIRLQGLGVYTTDTYSSSHGTYTSSGNRCLYISSAVAGSNPVTSTTFAIILYEGDGSQSGSGVVQNVTSTTFDIVWTITSSMVACKYLWEAN